MAGHLKRKRPLFFLKRNQWWKRSHPTWSSRNVPHNPWCHEILDVEVIPMGPDVEVVAACHQCRSSWVNHAGFFQQWQASKKNLIPKLGILLHFCNPANVKTTEPPWFRAQRPWPTLRPLPLHDVAQPEAHTGVKGGRVENRTYISLGSPRIHPSLMAGNPRMDGNFQLRKTPRIPFGVIFRWTNVFLSRFPLALYQDWRLISIKVCHYNELKIGRVCFFFNGFFIDPQVLTELDQSLSH